MKEVVDLARRVAKVDATVLITGESGAGATADRPGLFESANRGTLLLDEIGEVSPGMQVKLLRALQEREIRRVGESRSRPVDVRILAATNRDLAHGVAESTFRQDLYYRLKVVELHVPPLRDRRDDILPLARLLLAEAAIRVARKISGLAPNAADQLLRYDWPGNVRELENAMERAVALARGSRVDLEDLPEEIRQAFPKPVVNGKTVQLLSDVEKEYILAVMDLNDGNQTRTAKQLGIGSATLYRKLKKYGLIGKSPKGRNRTTKEPKT
jgi:transcriptional regulator with PAS, ATPase and Fis domain